MGHHLFLNEGTNNVLRGYARRQAGNAPPMETGSVQRMQIRALGNRKVQDRRKT